MSVHTKNTICVWFVILGSMLFRTSEISYAQIPRVDYDESGTLVMVGKTSDAVILVADSKITPSDGTHLMGEIIDPDRKIADIGKRSSCAVVGYVGPKDRDVANALRAWSAAHPTIDAFEGFRDLLAVAKSAWDEHHYTPLDISRHDGRRIGSEITFLICADFVGGHPTIVSGRTVVDDDLTARTEVLPSFSGDILYMSGVFDTTPKFLTLIDSPDLFLTGNPYAEKFQAVRQDIVTDTTTMSKLNDWRNADDAIRIQRAATPLTPTPYVASSWSESSTKYFFSSVFTTVERNFPDHVDKPNNVRLIRSCGRFETLLDAESWPLCPPSKTSPSTAKSKGIKKH
jgi:hypothetical protein